MIELDVKKEKRAFEEWARSTMRYRGRLQKTNGDAEIFIDPEVSGAFTGWLAAKCTMESSQSGASMNHFGMKPLGYKSLNMLQRRWRNIPPAVVRGIVRDTEREHGISQAGRRHDQDGQQTHVQSETPLLGTKQEADRRKDRL